MAFDVARGIIVDISLPFTSAPTHGVPGALDPPRGALLLQAFERAEFAVAVFDARTQRIEFVNSAFARKRGYWAEQMVGMSVDALYPTELVAPRREARKAIDAASRVVVETEQLTSDGRRFPVQLDCSVLRDAYGEPAHVIVFACDITARQRAERELQLAAAAFEIAQPLMVLDAQHRIRRVNGAFTALTGYPLEVAIGKTFPIVALSGPMDAYPTSFWMQLDITGFWRGEQWVRTRDGKRRAVERTFSVVRDARGKVTHYVTALHDQTRARSALADLDRATFSDVLTGLPNRACLHRQLQQLLDDGRAGSTLLVIIDLDHFERVNALYGHAIGDALLRQIAQRLQQQVDCVAVSRIGGDTFAYLAYPACDDSLSAGELGQAAIKGVREALREPFELEHTVRVGVTASAGWVKLVGEADADSALESAELALRDAQASGARNVSAYSPRLRARHRERERLVCELEAAISSGGFDLHPQLQVDGAGRAVGAELLLRWTRRDGQSVAPKVFIALAEQNRLMDALDEWVVARACALLADWRDRPALGRLVVAVNVSAGYLQQPEFVRDVQTHLMDAGADPTRLQLEITESAALGDLAATAEKLRQLRQLGVKLSLDDFGIGYSSMTYLARLPLDQLKIDQSFVAQVPTDRVSTVLVESMITMAHGLGLQVVAEGVETAAQREFLQARACDALQGYLYARPMPLAEFEAMAVRTSAPGIGVTDAMPDDGLRKP